ncbi:putative phage abortive infection protein [Dyadobacter jiangsuensis]|uniref:Putative phage abortive infection protein n=1 Tax=Dyadobacter jiangsuensis TaxID=1591085 RepID=A0A2P8GFQ5_9BACT|nr:putative phage abortive infection protein [Dyadobacter jiangsuensis]PSL32804.1 putative phage abortive infection protein [Dyadobacter jiangsuensis]
MNPFIAISGVIVTGLAFYIQYKANAQQRELFYKEQELNNKQLQEQINSQSSQYRLQQFDSQFYELLRLHRENINEMIITGYNYWEKKEGLERYNAATRGRKLFVVMKTEFHCILRIYKDVRNIDKEGFKVCYNIFFFGLDQFKRNYPNETKLIELLSNARKKHEEPDLEIIKSNKDRKIYSDDTSLYFNYKPFSGHASRLSHYFRHLYLTAKTIATTEIISEYEEKMKYFRMLRAQLSVHEQILLYYNWLSEFGSEWENSKNSLFTEYCMIRNLWFNDLFIDAFINSNINILRNKETKFRKGKMFENDN